MASSHEPLLSSLSSPAARSKRRGSGTGEQVGHRRCHAMGHCHGALVACHSSHTAMLCASIGKWARRLPVLSCSPRDPPVPQAAVASACAFVSPCCASQSAAEAEASSPSRVWPWHPCPLYPPPPGCGHGTLPLCPVTHALYTLHPTFPPPSFPAPSFRPPAPPLPPAS